jgi:hypothetical protein
MLDRDQSVDAPIAIRDRAISREFSMFTLTFSHDSETATQSFLCIDEFDIPVAANARRMRSALGHCSPVRQERRSARNSNITKLV